MKLHNTLKCAAALFISSQLLTGAPDLTLIAKDTLTIVEMDSGQGLDFTLRDGRTVRMELLESRSDMVFSTLEEPMKGSPDQRSIYRMTCRVRIDGQEVELVRYNPVQQTFYEPYTINGLSIWFDGLRSLETLFLENHGPCLPVKEARFALQDATLGVCPQPIGNWLPLHGKQLLVADAYGGEDTWMGPYFGADLHGGLDINVPSNTTLYAPIDFDDQFYFNSLAAGDNNNRWRGIREWPNGDIWHLQTHHLVEAIVPERIPLRQGQPYAFAGGVRAGYTSHVHFVMKVLQPGMDWILMDPWVLFQDSFRNNAEKSGALLAVIEPVAPGSTGVPLRFSSAGSRSGIWGNRLETRWDFGDGFTASEANPTHVFLKPGIYPVSLHVSDGVDQAVYTQHITISGEDLSARGFQVSIPDSPAMKPAKAWKTRASGDPVDFDHRLVFHRYQKQVGNYAPRSILVAPGVGMHPAQLADELKVETTYTHGTDWLEVLVEQTTTAVRIMVTPRKEALLFQHGFYSAKLILSHPDVLNSPAEVEILVNLQASNPAESVIVTNSGPDCVRSPYFWLAPEFHMPWVGGESGNFLINGRSEPDEYLIFRPNLAAGQYRVSLYGKPYAESELMSHVGTFDAIIRHDQGTSRVRIDPNQSLELGSFPFATGRAGSVEITSTGAKGMILVDALHFERIGEAETPAN